MTKKEYIERDKLYKFIEIFDAQYGDNIVFTKKELKHLIDIFPSADVAPVRHGEWVYEHWCEFVCSECGKYSKERGKEKYCPNCGALMLTY